MTQIFFSHSWQDKTLVDQIARDMEGACDIWLDTRETWPGESIAQDINEGITTSDLIVLLWSRHAAESVWVGKEIEFTQALQKKIIPVMIDETPLPDVLVSVLGIPALDWQDNYPGLLMRLNIALFREQNDHMLNESGIDLDLSSLINDFSDYDGLMAYINHYRQEKNIEGDAAQWIDRILALSNTAYQKGMKKLSALSEDVAFVKSLSQSIEIHRNDKAELTGILHEIQQNRHRSPALLDKMEQLVKQMLGSFSTEGEVAKPVTDDELPAEGSQLLRQLIRQALQEEQQTEQFEHFIAGQLGENGYAVTTENIGRVRDLLVSYVEALPNLLDAVWHAANEAAELDRLQPMLEMISAYFTTTDDLVSDRDGLAGLLDDAWLAFRMVGELDRRYADVHGASFIDPGLEQANGIVGLFLGQQLTTELEKKLQKQLMTDRFKKAGGTLLKVALGGLAAYGMYRLFASGEAEPVAANTQSDSWGNSFEDSLAQFYAENGMSIPDW